MSSEGFKGVPGVPEGWELVRFDYAFEGERYLTGAGAIVVHTSTKPTQAKRLIVRKIEVPKQYRPFAGAAEAEPFFDERLRWKGDEETRSSAIYRISVMDDDSVFIGHNEYGFREVFELFTKSDGTPFGVEVTE